MISLACETCDLLVFSHLKWDFLFHRPQHLVLRYARYRRVYYIEEPIQSEIDSGRLHIIDAQKNIQIIIPYLPMGLNEAEKNAILMALLDKLLQDESICEFSTLYYSPLAYAYSSHLKPMATMFDCVRENQEGLKRSELIHKSDLIFISIQDEMELTRSQTINTYIIPESVDLDHFYQARYVVSDPQDQINIPHPRIGYYGPIDEEFNLALLENLAKLRPDFHFIIARPILDSNKSFDLHRSNIHYLGDKKYEELPSTFAGWDCAIFPLKTHQLSHINYSIRTLQYLAAAKPVVATSLSNVIHPYADAKLAYIADHPEHFIECIEMAINESAYDPEWAERVDYFLERESSWDDVFKAMANLEMDITGGVKKTKTVAYLDHDLISIGIV